MSDLVVFKKISILNKKILILRNVRETRNRRKKWILVGHKKKNNL